MQLAQKTTLHYKRAVLPGPHAAPNHVRTLPVCRSDKMHVPSEGFGGLSPERKAANALRTLFTFVAARVVLAQLEGSGRGALGSYNAEAYQVLVDSLQLDPIKDGDQWIASLMRKNNSLALRVMEVRQTYCEQDFEWDQLQKLAVNDTKSANTKLMRSFATASFCLHN